MSMSVRPIGFPRRLPVATEWRVGMEDTVLQEDLHDGETRIDQLLHAEENLFALEVKFGPDAPSSLLVPANYTCGRWANYAA